ncbi:hypothetical protein PQX77_021807 [Marasmius sp. AFHP31]|nr:hypothetical protein PQX77_021807 [Marasmius sp. AFHP31]
MGLRDLFERQDGGRGGVESNSLISNGPTSIPKPFPHSPTTGPPDSSPDESTVSSAIQLTDTIPISGLTSTSTTSNPTATAKTPIPLPLSTTYDMSTAAPQEAVNRTPIIIGVVVGGTVGLILAAVVVIIIVRRRRNRGRPHRQAGWFTTGFRRRRRERQNLKVTALPITTPGPEHAAEKSRERRHQNADSSGPTVTDDQRVPGPAVDGQSRGTDSEMLAKLNMLIERAARSSPGPAVDGQSRGMDLEVLAKLDMIMEKVARLEEDRGREEEAPPDYVSNRS